MKIWWTAAAPLLLLLAVGMAAACGSDSATNSPSGSLTIELKDAPADEVTSINVYITGLTVKPTNGPIERVINDVGLVDILSLTDFTIILATTGLRAGSYDHLRVELDEARSTVVEKVSGEEKPLKISSEEIKVNGGFTIQENRETTVTLDFDARESLRKQGNGGWLLVPIIVQEKVVQE